MVAPGDDGQSAAQVVHVAKGQGDFALGVGFHDVQGGGGLAVGLQQLGPGHAPGVLQPRPFRYGGG